MSVNSQKLKQIEEEFQLYEESSTKKKILGRRRRLIKQEKQVRWDSLDYFKERDIEKKIMEKELDNRSTRESLGN